MDFIVHVGANIICPHAGQVNATTSNTRVYVLTQPVVTEADLFTISGCGQTPNPCVIVNWTVPSLRISVNGRHVILKNSEGMCQPGGPPNIVMTQIRVRGT